MYNELSLWSLPNKLKKITMKLNKVCIGIPVYNGETFIRQALNSLLNQTYRDFYVVIVDDGSTDNSGYILKEYVKQDKRITLVTNPQRTGLVAAWIKVAELSEELFNPEYFAWYSDHDWVAKDWLERLVNLLENDSEVALVHSQVIQVDENGVEREDLRESPIDTSAMGSYEALQAVTFNYFGGAGDAIYGLFRFNVLKRCGIFPNEIFPDLLIISECCLYGSIKHISTTIRYRRENRSLTFKETRERQKASLFSEEYEIADAPLLLGNATFFFRKIIQEPQSDDSDLLLRRIYHAWFFAERLLLKMDDVHNLDAIKENNELVPFAEFASAIISASDTYRARLAKAQVKLHRYKKLNSETESYNAKLWTVFQKVMRIFTFGRKDK